MDCYGITSILNSLRMITHDESIPGEYESIIQRILNFEIIDIFSVTELH